MGLGLNEGLGSTAYAKATEGRFATDLSLRPPERAGVGDALQMTLPTPMPVWNVAHSPAPASG